MNTVMVTDDAGVLSERELKLTAALYARLGAHRHVRRRGRLPKLTDDGCHWVPVQEIVRARGVDLSLTPDEQLVYDAFCRAGRVPGGAVRVMEKAG
jgi:hypothetical protein